LPAHTRGVARGSAGGRLNCRTCPRCLAACETPLPAFGFVINHLAAYIVVTWQFLATMPLFRGSRVGALRARRSRIA
jgi:hypothetical protein